MKTTLLSCAVGLVVTLAAERTRAQTLETTLVNISPGLNGNGNFDGSFFFDYPSGVNHFTESEAFWVDPLQSLSYGETLIYDIKAGRLTAAALLISKLIGGYLESGQTDQDTTAVHRAIWETVQEASAAKTLSSGNVRISPSDVAVATLADWYLDNAKKFNPVTIIDLTDPDRQDLVAWYPVPEPTTIGLAGLSALLLLRRR